MTLAPRLVVFDWDGTLSDSAHGIVRTCVQAMRDYGHPAPEDARIRALIGLTLEQTFHRLLPDVSQRDVNRVIRRYRELWALGAARPSRLIDGARDCLDRLADGGALLAVATGKSRRGLERELAGHALDSVFTTTRCADESPPKPAPDMLLEILAELGVAAEGALMVGDTSYDMAMARAAGVARVGVRSGAHDESVLLPFTPLDVLDDVSALPRWLAARPPESWSHDEDPARGPGPQR